MSDAGVSGEERVLAVFRLSPRALSVDSFAELFDSIRSVAVSGPDERGRVWLKGLCPDSGRLRTIDLGPASEPMARAALRWRDHRRHRDRRH